jgi:hypothetical protein
MLLFATHRHGYLELYTLHLAGLELTRLTRNAAPDYDPGW